MASGTTPTFILVIQFLAVAGIFLILILLDLIRRLDLLRPLPLTLVLLITANAVLLGYRYYTTALHLPPGWRIAHLAALGSLLLYCWLRLNIWPRRDQQPVGPRLKIMMGGRTIIYTALWAMLLEALLLLIFWGKLWAAFPWEVLMVQLIYVALLLFSLLINGILRIFFTSYRLSIVRRVVMLLTMWVPLINLCVLLYACRLVYEEYDFACVKEQMRSQRVEKDLCRTRYPLVMVHGILFRDLKYFNYWGRIPQELIRLGAIIYYGNQEAVGTIATNAADLARKIIEVKQETGAEKVNIIAHSKGGLDARYAITALGMADSVASLTTISTPHRGCRFVDYAVKLPEPIYRFIAKRVDNTFRKFGDQNPDFYTATHQFTTSASAAFNEQVPDAPGVYYQSYMSQLGGALSDRLLALTYRIIKPLEGANDGLVATTSAPWGEFRQLFVPAGKRGISHGDIIDLKREDYRGFDVREAFVELVSDLKAQGY